MSSKSHGLKPSTEEGILSRSRGGPVKEDIKSDVRTPFHMMRRLPHNGESGSSRSGSSRLGSVDDVDAKYKAIVANKKKAAAHNKEHMRHTMTQDTQLTMAPRSDDDLYAEFLEYKKMHKEQVVRDVKHSAHASVPPRESLSDTKERLADNSERLAQAKKAYAKMYPHASGDSSYAVSEKQMRDRRQIERDELMHQNAQWDYGVRSIHARNRYEKKNPDAPRAYLGVY